eukprot:CAMPEP_0172457340 /NCGR_PEP_ID=MMETSP1065-20121228/21627_1 /TAXON_ID=265537 /ORGANISM="Amphiprora paludosa, Strain CCMP125" /LENGTH=125 /DNA_ID=CAMNT_0013211017 /DNA_START=14 /DNA_END=391 /DNA_ORIENTATION=-
MNDNQNIYVRDGRSTSRVIAPPGGVSSISLGMAPPIPGMGPPPTKKKDSPPPPKEEEAPTETVSPTSATEPPSVATESATKKKTVSANAFASGANANGAQVMTGRPTSKVIHKGGGGGPVSWKLG